MNPRTAKLLALILGILAVVVWFALPSGLLRILLVFTIALVALTCFDRARFPGDTRTESTMGPAGDVLIGFEALVVSVAPLKVEARGSVWSARLAAAGPVSERGYVEVVGREGLTLLVRPSASDAAIHLRELARELCELARRDEELCAELAADGSLFDGYHPRMEAVHRQNAARLAAIVDEIGWPSVPLVGAEASEAAWLIAQHAIGEPALLRRVLGLLRDAAARDAVPPWQTAMLEDRIRMYEGRPQLYGTQLVADLEGWLRPHPIEEPDGVDERRKRLGLGPLPSEPRRAERILSPAEREVYEREYQAWLKRAGWRRE